MVTNKAKNAEKNYHHQVALAGDRRALEVAKYNHAHQLPTS